MPYLVLGGSSKDVPAGKGLPALTEIKLIDYDREKAAADKKRLIDRWLSEVAGS